MPWNIQNMAQFVWDKSGDNVLNFSLTDNIGKSDAEPLVSKERALEIARARALNSNWPIPKGATPDLTPVWHVRELDFAKYWPEERVVPVPAWLLQVPNAPSTFVVDGLSGKVVAFPTL